VGRCYALVLLAGACGRIGFDDRSALLDLDFAAGDTTGVAIARSTPATYLDAAGVLRTAGPHQPRFDHDAITLAPTGLLLERAATNLALSSERLDTGDWFTNGEMAVVADVALAPDGTTTADALDDTDTAIIARRALGVTVPDDLEPYTCSGFVHAATLTQVDFGCELLKGSSEIQQIVGVDLLSGAVNKIPSDAVAYGADPYPGGWYRVYLTIRNNGTGNNNGILSFWSDRDNIALTGRLLAWGGQFEHGAFPSSYISTTAAALTRDADAASLDVPAAMLAEGTVRAIASTPYDAFVTSACVLATASDRACIDRNLSQAVMSFDIASTTGTDELAGASWPVHATRSAAFAWSSTAIRFADGIATQRESPATLSGAFSKVSIGTDTVTDGLVRVDHITLWPTAMTLSELAAVAQ